MTGAEEIRAIHLSEDLWKGKKQKGILHSTFDRAVNFLLEVEGEKRMVTVLREEVPLAPDSISVSASFFSHFLKRPECVMLSEERCFLLDGRRAEGVFENLFLPEKIGAVRAKGLSERLSEAALFLEGLEKKSDLEGLPDKYREKVSEMAAACLAKEKEGVEKAFFGMVGAGRGLTPSLDDAAVGIMAGAYGLSAVSGELFQGIYWRLGREKWTTEVSCKYLKCACKGCFSKPVLEVTLWLLGGEGELPKNRLREMAATGHTSGMDTLYGLFRVLGGAVRCIG